MTPPLCLMTCVHTPRKAFTLKQIIKLNLKLTIPPCGCGGGAPIKSQHLGGRSRQISEFKASLVYRVSSRTVRAIYTEKPCLGKTKTKQNKTKKASKEMEHGNKGRAKGDVRTC